ncbi:expressed unknown protein [Seminavis robusta]|uniref:Uncharacterized protein n=1 Tax=Seminavis robusta TaxID=568900 RepID=A0A9N8D8R6_9STRA|nr:expressed unknown protein [Seminavis robusta]|eukprot:Sro43_g025890.1 n/a (238) ;mRNA; r:6684-7397
MASSKAGPRRISPPHLTDDQPAAERELPVYMESKRGGTCCGCCCDFRRAVIIANCLIIGLSAYSLGGLMKPPDEETLEAYEDYRGVTIDDDQVVKDLTTLANDALLANAVVGGVMLVLTAIPIYGAYTYQSCPVGFGIFLLVSSFVVRFMVAYVMVEDAGGLSDELAFEQPWVLYGISALFMLLFIYPHIALILEIRKGIMTYKTYPRESYSCCCTRERRQLPPQSQPPKQPMRAYV